MIPTSKAQFNWTLGDELPRLEQVRERIWALALGMPDGRLHYSLAYFVVDDARKVHVIDPGYDTDDNWSRILAALTQLECSVVDVASIVCTHMHPDHLGAADKLRKVSGASITMLRAELLAMQTLNDPLRTPTMHIDQFSRWGVPKDRAVELEPFRESAASTTVVVADVAVDHGDVLDIPGHCIQVLATPGHTTGHLCLIDTDSGVIFTGDHVLPVVFPGIGLDGLVNNDEVADYLESLDLVSRFDDCEVLPGHGYRFRGLASRCDAIAVHHLRRAREVEAALAADPQATAWQIAGQITWTAGWENLTGYYVVSALRQMDMHIAFVRSERGRGRLRMAETLYGSLPASNRSGLQLEAGPNSVSSASKR